MDIKIETLMAQMHEARYRLNCAMDKIDPQAEICPSWGVKQVMDHITGWDELVASTLRQYQRGETPERVVKSLDKFNTASVAERQELSLEQSREAYDSARLQVLQALRNLPAEMTSARYPAPWGGRASIAGILKIFVEHEREHAEQIEKIAGTAAKPE